MKKSTLLYWGMHVVILLIPFFFLSALRFKIATGDIVDVIAAEAAGMNVHRLPVIHEIEISSSAKTTDGNLKLIVIPSDSLQEMKIDTASSKYISYTIEGDKLVLVYDFQRDNKNHIANVKMQHERYDSEYASSYNSRVVTVYLQSNIRAIKARKTNVSLAFPNDDEKINDLDVVCYGSDFTLDFPDRWKTDKEGDQVKTIYEYQHRLGLHLFENSNATLNNLGYIKQYDLELKGGSGMDHHFSASTFNLSIDKKSNYMMNVNDLPGARIKYE